MKSDRFEGLYNEYNTMATRSLKKINHTLLLNTRMHTTSSHSEFSKSLKRFVCNFKYMKHKLRTLQCVSVKT